MNVFSLIAIVLGIVVFVAAHLAVQRKWATIPLGLALVWAGFLLHVILRTEHLVSITWD